MSGDRELAYLALGSNLGDRAAHLREARAAVERLPATRVLAASAVEETEPLGGMRQPPYLNQMLLVETGLDPRALLAACQEIELRAGRVRGGRWGPRTLDVDIVRYGHRTITEPDLVVPHPGIADRDFWQRELAELEPHAR
ncbi:MAG TPA: 2-amino-4-hydroxy-6-hydroxymethyldihydropteridine diphosphokinase [Gemmatimonadales bacterium]|nr:2-amino-4-hydroxy-6-hydroxymethyldihydropteridine diphosphokinase [Gemmatimonadales bacterium]